ncbi:hypothetical protein L228DRAFT_239839 [Xylona heveae TC161]|uniref:Uncharacterized protein n=1 Tax=Xylona heveae (strain CBS 132557 / TC161) TaxID=1328760 RepID=A0A165G9N7_XYLHT|nr:hypothetical protein L228DRAFT_239839 [Xylona heveae TC161]KZF21912.1 hypothetical protein L228DRAFT_239839 [Xylona heveae TC161]
MSESIAIPKPKGARLGAAGQGVSASSSSSSASSPSNFAAHLQGSPTFSPSSTASSSPLTRPYHDRRPSLLSSSISKSEHTVIDVGHPGGPPRLITCVKASQGFDWNQDIFLPAYADYESSASLEHRRDPVHDIVLTDAEMQSILPQ